MLEGKTILIGKEPGQGRLLIVVKDGSNIKSAVIGGIGCVPGSVSRCKPAEDVGHCKLTIDQNSVMTLTNLKPQNVTYVNDMEIMSKHVTADSNVSLGKDRYAINIQSILEIAGKLVAQNQGQAQSYGQQKQVEVSIKHLKAIWDKYDTTLLNLQIEQQKKANQQRLQGIVSMSGMLLAILPSATSWDLPEWIQGLRVVFIIAALGLGFYFFIMGSKVKDSFLWKKRELDQKFMKDYVCPNKECNHFMGTQPYVILSQNKKCPYCGCKYSEK